MPSNYVLLREVTVGAAGAASVTLANIPQTGYTDLKIYTSVRSNAAGGGPNDWLTMSFNGSSSSFTFREMEGNGTAAGAYSGSSGFSVAGTTVGQTANTFASGDIYIPNYTGSNQKAYSVDTVTENNGSSSLLSFLAGTWANTAAINSITFGMNSGTLFSQYSTFYLYGIAAVGITPVIAPFATGGDIIQNDGTYWIHTFLSSGTFTPQKSLSCDYLVVAGGGGMGASGAGAGGLRSSVTATGGGGSLESPLSLVTQGYPVTVGAGGAASPNGQAINGLNGNNSMFSTITSVGGAAGRHAGTPQSNFGLSGGSGSGGYAGGDGVNNGITYTGGAGTANQGYAGGSAAPKASASSSSGGGGGAGQVGGNAASTSSSGVGGNGVAISITGSSVTYGGGGGGGHYDNGSTKAGGTGGGGTGSTGNAAGSGGIMNTGGGAGGAYSEAYKAGGYAGGSGIVIIRYPMV